MRNWLIALAVAASCGMAAPSARAGAFNEKVKLVVPVGPLQGSKLDLHVVVNVKQNGLSTVHVMGSARLTTSGKPPWDLIASIKGKAKVDLSDGSPATLTVDAKAVVPGQGQVLRIRVTIDLDIFGIKRISPELVLPLELDIEGQIPTNDAAEPGEEEASGLRDRDV